MSMATTITRNTALSLATGSRARVSGVGTHRKETPLPSQDNPGSPRSQNGRGAVEMSYPSTGRTFRERFGVMLNTVALRCRYQQKHIARMTGANVKTVANWLSGQNLPAAEHLITLMREEDEIFFAVLAMAERLPEGLTEEQRFHLLQALKLLQEKA